MKREYEEIVAGLLDQSCVDSGIKAAIDAIATLSADLAAAEKINRQLTATSLRLAGKLETAEAEIARLNQCIQWEQHRAERIGTHSETCGTWGPQHYECLLREHEARGAEIERLREALTPFANLGVTTGPDDEPCSIPYRITRGSIRNARAALNHAAEGK
jgi:hypothetical protein